MNGFYNFDFIEAVISFYSAAFFYICYLYSRTYGKSETKSNWFRLLLLPLGAIPTYFMYDINNSASTPEYINHETLTMFSGFFDANVPSVSSHFILLCSIVILGLTFDVARAFYQDSVLDTP